MTRLYNTGANVAFKETTTKSSDKVSGRQVVQKTAHIKNTAVFFQP